MLGCTVISIGALFAGIDRLGAPAASVLSSWEVVVTMAISASLFGEAITVVQMIGGVFILVAVGLYQ
ncbi:EamA family transporter [Microcoleus sp. FACHB-1515]|uniref:EamA family transporter n=1 Tax=Cyanophyceae TaxID=3028117 RepID=UPI0016826855|nr:EamA family transporter [Microcoleus sp. FACHB-1515]MBD2088325.1 EamA family transporter [Microcoleus sp. FACHB-1515]